MKYTITREDGADDAAALRYALEFESVKHSTHSTALRALADSIEEQVKPAIEEPTEQWSVVRARPAWQDAELREFTRLKGGFWVDRDGNECGPWNTFTDVEVLRVGLQPEPLAEWETQLFNEQERRDIAAAVLSAMDVDQYLIDAVVNARPR